MMEPSRKLPSVPKRLLKEKRPVTVTATKPGQIVCWDVTFLPHVFTGSRFAACVFVDLYSRQIIGFEVGYRESAAGASALWGQYRRGWSWLSIPPRERVGMVRGWCRC